MNAKYFKQHIDSVLKKRTHWTNVSVLNKFIICCLLGYPLAACSVSTRLTYEDQEGAVPESVFSSIKRNKTPKKWLVQHLGEPLSIYQTKDGGELYTYQMNKASYKRASLLFVLRYKTVKREARYFHIRLKDDKVKKTWWDEHAIASSVIDQNKTPPSFDDINLSFDSKSAKD